MRTHAEVKLALAVLVSLLGVSTVPALSWSFGGGVAVVVGGGVGHFGVGIGRGGGGIGIGHSGARAAIGLGGVGVGIGHGRGGVGVAHSGLGMMVGHGRGDIGAGKISAAAGRGRAGFAVQHAAQGPRVHGGAGFAAGHGRDTVHAAHAQLGARTGHDKGSPRGIFRSALSSADRPVGTSSTELSGGEGADTSKTSLAITIGNARDTADTDWNAKSGSNSNDSSTEVNNSAAQNEFMRQRALLEMGMGPTRPDRGIEGALQWDKAHPGWSFFGSKNKGWSFWDTRARTIWSLWHHIHGHEQTATAGFKTDSSQGARLETVSRVFAPRTHGANGRARLNLGILASHRHSAIRAAASESRVRQSSFRYSVSQPHVAKALQAEPVQLDPSDGQIQPSIAPVLAPTSGVAAISYSVIEPRPAEQAMDSGIRQKSDPFHKSDSNAAVFQSAESALNFAFDSHSVIGRRHSIHQRAYYSPLPQQFSQLFPMPELSLVGYIFGIQKSPAEHTNLPIVITMLLSMFSGYAFVRLMSQKCPQCRRLLERNCLGCRDCGARLTK